MFYSKFLKNHSTILAPLNKLLQKNVVFVWTKVENDAFILDWLALHLKFGSVYI